MCKLLVPTRNENNKESNKLMRGSSQRVNVRSVIKNSIKEKEIKTSSDVRLYVNMLLKHISVCVYVDTLIHI